MGFLHRVKVLFGLADEYDEYDDDEYYDPDQEQPETRWDGKPYRSPYSSESSAVRRVMREPDLERAREVAASRSNISELRAVEPRPQVKMHIAEPKTFSEAQVVADRFREGTPVILNLTGTDPDLSKRLIDFCSGLTYGLNGGLKKVSERVFMLTPENVDVSAEDRRRLRDKGLFTLDG